MVKQKNRTRILGLICARGGSKGIPRKNIKALNGKPLIAYAVEAGLRAQYIDRVVVSTDDQNIADVARQYGADVPFIRPAELAADKTLQIDAIRHAVITLKEQGQEYDVVALLQPTCPLRMAEDVDGALGLLIEKDADTVITVTPVGGYHPLTMYRENPEDGTICPLMDSDQQGVLRQNFETVLWRNGAVYAIRVSTLLEDHTLYGKKVYGYLMPQERAANIDEPLDWVVAEALLNHMSKQREKGS